MIEPTIYFQVGYGTSHLSFKHSLGADLDAISRPADVTGMRVPPAGLLEYCVSNNYVGPCCLCPLNDASKPNLVEAAFELAGAGVLSGEYVARCAEDYCGYIGM